MTARCLTHRSTVKLRAQHNLVQAQTWSAQHGKLHSLETLIPGRSLFLQKKRDALFIFEMVRIFYQEGAFIGEHGGGIVGAYTVNRWLAASFFGSHSNQISPDSC